jgi:Fic-DOC domain mobile mystery protein B
MGQEIVKLVYPVGATPLDEDELSDLIPEHVTTQTQLNELEQANIARSDNWTSKTSIKVVADETFLRRLHKEMFGDVWKWAGNFRKTEKTIGVAPDQIAIRLRDLCNDVRAWVEHSTYSPDEIAARFHHRLVYIHPFVNGNGRHARIAADLLLEKNLHQAKFTWGNTNLNRTGEARERYINALKAADDHDYGPLFNFIRT